MALGAIITDGNQVVQLNEVPVVPEPFLLSKLESQYSVNVLK